jgi:hypothetical protein
MLLRWLYYCLRFDRGVFHVVEVVILLTITVQSVVLVKADLHSVLSFLQLWSVKKMCSVIICIISVFPSVILVNVD